MMKKSFLIDMDGVLVHGKKPIEGANKFIQALKDQKRKFLVLTNNPLYTRRDLAHRLQGMDIPVNEEQIYTSANATAAFLDWQKPKGTAFVIGELGLSEAIHAIGYIQTSEKPDYVVLGETFSYNMQQITTAVRLIKSGARFIATNPDPTGPSESGVVPAGGAMAALIEKASGVAPLFIGKPNAVMMRLALNDIDAHSEETIMIGDRMDTDILAGTLSGMETILVLSGVTDQTMIERFPYRPTYVRESIAQVKPEDFDTRAKA
ncbi:MAG TPA: HAD-IIA family hydrolase [Anaerolineaceae bacterium]|nr:HAD-IIA family hydrolase [Anaerolineaceae bacterium]